MANERTEDIEDRLRAFIVDELGWHGAASTLTSDYQLIENDVIDSMGIFELVSFIEGHYGIAIDDDELVLDNFATLASMSRLVRKKIPA